MITEKEYKALKSEVEESKAEAERAKGALDQLMRQLTEDFECSDLSEAKELLKKMEKGRDMAEKDYEKALKKYSDKWINKI